MTYDIDVDSLVRPLKYAKVCPRKFAASGEADSEPLVPLVDAIFHLEEDVLLGPVHHPRELHLLDGIQSHLMHLIGRDVCGGRDRNEICHHNDIIIVRKRFSF